MRSIQEPKPGFYAGQSLRYIRDVIDVSGPKFPSVLHFIERYRDRLQPVPMVGQVVVYDNPDGGDIGLYVGNGLALFMDHNGSPRLHPITMPWGRPQAHDYYRGAMWWPEEDS